ncbi:MAG: uroporphyrinogen decarboxylase family protein [Pseudomonadota bacterium]
MTKRARVIDALNHIETDIVPYHAGFTMRAHEAMADYLGDPDFHEKIGDHLHYMTYSAPMQAVAGKEGFIRDGFGVVWNRSGVDKDIGIIVEPFVCSLEAYTFPTLELDERDVRNMCESLLRDSGERFTFSGIGFSMFERAWTLCGMENVLMGMILYPEALEQLLDDICDYNMKILDILLDYDLDGVYFGDDWGQQKGLIMGAENWRRFIKPRMKRMYQRVKESGKFVLQHSCGDIEELFPDLIEIGLDCYQTFQPEIYDIEKIKAQYGDKLSFWGGISTQHILPHGTPDEVKNEVARIIKIMRKGGGYIAAPTHSLTYDIPPENIAAMLEVFRQNVD